MPVEFSKCHNLSFDQQIRDSKVDSDFCVCSNILLIPLSAWGPQIFQLSVERLPLRSLSF